MFIDSDGRCTPPAPAPPAPAPAPPPFFFAGDDDDDDEEEPFALAGEAVGADCEGFRGVLDAAAGRARESASVNRYNAPGEGGASAAFWLELNESGGAGRGRWGDEQGASRAVDWLSTWSSGEVLGALPPGCCCWWW